MKPETVSYGFVSVPVTCFKRTSRKMVSSEFCFTTDLHVVVVVVVVGFCLLFFISNLVFDKLQ